MFANSIVSFSVVNSGIKSRKHLVSIETQPLAANYFAKIAIHIFQVNAFMNAFSHCETTLRPLPAAGPGDAMHRVEREEAARGETRAKANVFTLDFQEFSWNRACGILLYCRSLSRSFAAQRAPDKISKNVLKSITF